ncbi:MAG TPA: hypothetical protein VES19_16135, partial [Candidatus Limnocylindrales bacterium]|nr:hypothetical protein [Candidatus Limnocylindrales bacterium]
GHAVRTRHPSAIRSTLLILVTGVLFGCGTTVVPSPPVSTSTTPVPATHLECQEVEFDPAASLGPEFANELFLRDESKEIARAFIDGLAGIYARRPNADPCALFTARGMRTAMETDARLRDVIEDRTRVESDLVLRVAFEEGDYDLRVSPPTVPLSIVFDLPAGSRTTDLRSGTTTLSPGDQRAGLHVTFVYDGHRWLADRVGRVEGEDAAWLVTPTLLPPGDPCTRFTPDPAGTPFDEMSGTDFLVDPPRPARTWCDAGGRGRVIDEAQLVLTTRYPCNRASAAVLTIGLPLGMPIDRLDRNEFVRDPADEFLAQGWVTAPFEPDATLPADAASTGWTNGNAELWISPSDLANAIYVRVGEATERWPRAADGWGVIDCN